MQAARPSSSTRWHTPGHRHRRSSPPLPPAPPPVSTVSTPEEQDLLARLKDWRRETAAARHWPAYLVLPDKTLEAIAVRRPATMADLAGCPGIGPIKLDLYGEQLLELVAEDVP